MNKTKIITLVCWVIVAAVLVGLAIWLATGNLFGINTNFSLGSMNMKLSLKGLTEPYKVVGTYEIPAKDISAVDISWTAGAVTVTPYDGDSIKLTEYARRDLEENEKLTYEMKGSTLNVRYDDGSIHVGVNILTKKLEILIPDQLASGLTAFELNATSASIDVSGVTADDLNVHSTSGSVNLSAITAVTSSIGSTSGGVDISDFNTETASISTTSGSIKVQALQADSLKLGSLSGGIRLKDVTADAVKASSTSGSLHLSGTFKNIEAGSTSGSISLTDTVNPDTVKCTTTSGSIEAALPGDADMTVAYSTTSGRFRSDLPVRTVSGDAPYVFRSTSGSITLKAAS
jgi:HSP20 family molecular chaperone IbpA